ncbi:NepR family anti-sigma factor [Falsiroseomonas sp. HC035]|uniref:NepR family anti-sigma factor n=1 Tax=Falsiroseomonas sp. HC035 TaxID=3390999 RepID=UPI003D32055B
METQFQPQAAPRTPADPSDRPGPRPLDRRPERPPTAFDRWLQAELSQAYEDALREPVPDELLKLINDPIQGRG